MSPSSRLHGGLFFVCFIAAACAAYGRHAPAEQQDVTGFQGKRGGQSEQGAAVLTIQSLDVTGDPDKSGGAIVVLRGTENRQEAESRLRDTPTGSVKWRSRPRGRIASWPAVGVETTVYVRVAGRGAAHI